MYYHIQYDIIQNLPTKEFGQKKKVLGDFSFLCAFKLIKT